MLQVAQNAYIRVTNAGVDISDRDARWDSEEWSSFWHSLQNAANSPYTAGLTLQQFQEVCAMHLPDEELAATIEDLWELYIKRG
jgi:hypothetical protein